MLIASRPGQHLLTSPAAVHSNFAGLTGDIFHNWVSYSVCASLQHECNLQVDMHAACSLLFYPSSIYENCTCHSKLHTVILKAFLDQLLQV